MYRFKEKTIAPQHHRHQKDPWNFYIRSRWRRRRGLSLFMYIATFTYTFMYLCVYRAYTFHNAFTDERVLNHGPALPCKYIQMARGQRPDVRVHWLSGSRFATSLRNNRRNCGRFYQAKRRRYSVYVDWRWYVRMRIVCSIRKYASYKGNLRKILWDD